MAASPPAPAAPAASRGPLQPAEIRGPLLDLYQRLDKTETGLKDAEARRRLEEHGPNELSRERRRSIPMRILALAVHPLVLLLVGIAAVSITLGEWASALVVS